MNRIPVAGDPALSLLRAVGPEPEAPAVLFVHGTTFPSRLASGYRFNGKSWMDDLAEVGFDVWALDFAGYGDSARYAEMGGGPTDVAPLGRVPQAAEQMTRAAALISEAQGGAAISVIAHSWGSLVAARYAANHPERVARLVLFAPICRREAVPFIPNFPAYEEVTLDAQLSRFIEDVPEGESPVLEEFEAWGQAYLASDPDASERNPPAVRIPGGPLADITSAWAGYFAYDPRAIRAATLIVRGEWDSLCTEADVTWLRQQLTAAASIQDAVISRGTHLLHLEVGRHGLYKATRRFLLRA